MTPIRPLAALAGAALAALLLVAAGGGSGDAGAPGHELAERHRRFLEETAPLLSAAEREVFLGFPEDYQRDGFVEAFWRARDPYPSTPRNELREGWEARLRVARDELGGPESPRGKLFLALGEPSRKRPYSCIELLERIEVWSYDSGSERIRGDFTLVFLGRPGGPGERLWQPLEGLAPLFLPGSALAARSDVERAALLGDCPRGDELLGDLSRALDLAEMERQGALYPPAPSDEWVRTLAARSTALPADAEPLPAEVRIAFPGRNQSRTVVQGLIEIPRAAAGVSELGPRRAYDFLLDGEVLRAGELFERFRYRFDFPLDLLPPGEGLPLVFERALRPGPYTLILKVEDAASPRAFRRELAIEVPAVATAPPAAVVSTNGGGAPPAGVDVGSPLPAPEAGLPAAGWLAEANAAIPTGDHAIRVLALPDVLTVGKLRVEARAQGDGIARVAFFLGGRPVMRRSRPPYTVELELGSEPRVHELRVEALDAAGKVLAADEVLVNAGPHRFAVRLIEPRRGVRYGSSVRALAAVEVPEGETLERLELYLGEDRVATLYGPPFEQPLPVPPDAGPTYVRALAVLAGGPTAEDVVFINAPDLLEEVEVDFVELYTTVVDRKGQFVEGVTREDFVVREDGAVQEVRRFEAVRDLPIRAGLVLDTSLSMLTQMREVEKAAYRFLETVLQPRDRAAVFTFNDRPQLVVRFTGDTQVLAGGLAGLVAEGETALYDAIVYALHYFSGLKGKRAVVLLTDGADSRSTSTFEDAIGFARRTGVAIYVIGLALPAGAPEVRMKMERLARETGGDFFSIERAAQLGSIYERIQNELRSQYLLAYQSSNAEADGETFRRVEVEVRRPGLEARTIRGYFP